MAYQQFDETIGGTASAHELQAAIPVHEKVRLEEAGFDTNSGSMVNGTAVFSKSTHSDAGEGGKSAPHEEQGFSGPTEASSPNPNASQNSLTPKPKAGNTLHIEARAKQRYAALVAMHTPAPTAGATLHKLKSAPVETHASTSPTAQLSAGHLNIPGNGAVAKLERKMDHGGNSGGLAKRMEYLGATLGDAPHLRAFS